ncbi:flippase [Roseovarius indicus]|uniref:flippase n=1 Tax=Roseovarius indicus TaxID=540747 RepID=UPI003512D1FD
MKLLQGRTVLSMGLKFVALGLGFSSTVVLTRMLGQAEIGFYSLGLSIMMVASVVVGFGLPTLATREYARYRESDDFAVIRAFGRFSLATTIGFSAVGVVLVWILFGYLIPTPDGFLTYLPLVLLLIPLHSLMKLLAGQVRGMHRVVESQLPELLIRPALLFGVLAAAYLLGSDRFHDLSQVFWLYAFGSVVGAAYALWVLRRMLRHANVGLSDQHSARWRNWLVVGTPLMLSNAVVVINQNIDVIVVGVFSPPEDIAVYRIATRLTALVAFGLAAVGAVVSPQIARLFHNNDIEGLEAIARQGAIRSFALSVPFAFVFIVFPTTTLTLAFGANYAAGAPVLVILTIGQLINASFGVLGVLLNMTELERYAVLGVTTAAVANIALNLILVPSLGVTGAAIAQAASLLIWNSMLFWFIWKRLGIVVLPFVPAKRSRGRDK